MYGKQIRIPCRTPDGNPGHASNSNCTYRHTHTPLPVVNNLDEVSQRTVLTLHRVDVDGKLSEGVWCEGGERKVPQ